MPVPGVAAVRTAISMEYQVDSVTDFPGSPLARGGAQNAKRTAPSRRGVTPGGVASRLAARAPLAESRQTVQRARVDS